ncbi:MAG: alpha/beta fold hydrolase [Spirochaetota bacterium]
MTERTIEVDGKKILVRESEGGTESYPTLLLIHGNLGSGRWFEPFLRDYPGRAFAPDMPNFGQSDHIDDCSIEGYGRWLGAICDEIGIASAAVLGHSLGGAVAMELLVQRPAFVSRLILVDSSPIEGLVTPKEYHPAIEAYKSDKAVLAQALKGVVPTLSDERFLALLVEDAWKMNRECFIGHAETLGTADYREKLTRVEIPVHVLRGELDMLITEHRAAETAAHFGGEVITFEGSGHSPMVEQPERFRNTVEEILGGVV